MVTADLVQNQEVGEGEAKDQATGEGLNLRTTYVLESPQFLGIHKGYIDSTYKVPSDEDWESIKHLFDKVFLISNKETAAISIRDAFSVCLLKHFLDLSLGTHVVRRGLLNLVSNQYHNWKKYGVMDLAIAILEARWAPESLPESKPTS